MNGRAGVIVAVLDAGARRRVAPCCDQLIISSQNTRTLPTSASRGILLMASVTSLTRLYTRGSTYTRVLNFGHFFDHHCKREGRLICGSTCTRVHTVVPKKLWRKIVTKKNRSFFGLSDIALK